MKLPIHVHCNTDLAPVEERWRKSVRNDRAVPKNLNSVSVMLYEHDTGIIGVMYEAQYRNHDVEYKAALDVLGFKLVKTVQMLTRHATILRRVK